MTSSLIPERPLVISPTLAATIGLNEAVLLQVLADLIHHQPGLVRQQCKWVELSDSQLANALPFWTAGDISNVTRSLIGLGLLLRDPGPAARDTYLYAFDERVAASVVPPAARPPGLRTTGLRENASPSGFSSGSSSGSTYMDANWQPGPDCIRQCRQHNIPEAFIQSLLPAFVQYWRDRGTAEFSWGNKFCKHALWEWRNEQSRQGAIDSAQVMSADWWPSSDALEILENAGINRAFIEDAVPEFILYWRERDEKAGAWNTKFIDHIRRQWARFSASFGVDDVPRPIVENWRPSPECFDILQLAEIDEEYARDKVPEFILYWKDSGQARASWNTVFLQFIKHDWARRLQSLHETDAGHAGHGKDQDFAGASQQRLKEKFQRFTDRSWAE